MKILGPILCVYCADMAELREDRNGGIYASCSFCGTRTFFKTPKGVEGYRLTASLLQPHVAAHQQTLRIAYEQALIARESARRLEESRREREERDKRRPRQRNAEE